MIKEFVHFVREKGVIGLAVGIIVGGAVTQFVNAIIKDLIDPIIGAVIGGGQGLASYAYTIPATDITFTYGNLISELINFVAILLVIYLLFVKSPLNKLDKKGE
jgi:large conductance mechanosensitive channel